jgi:hypothetical protein
MVAGLCALHVGELPHWSVIVGSARRASGCGWADRRLAEAFSSSRTGCPQGCSPRRLLRLPATMIYMTPFILFVLGVVLWRQQLSAKRRFEVAEQR